MNDMIEKSFGSVWDSLDGHKTQIGAVIYAVLTVLFAFKKIDQQMFETFVVLNTGWTAFSMRDAIKKME